MWLRVAVEGIPGEGISRKLSNFAPTFGSFLLDFVVVRRSGAYDYRRRCDHRYEDQANQKFMHAELFHTPYGRLPRKRFFGNHPPSASKFCW